MNSSMLINVSDSAGPCFCDRRSRILLSSILFHNLLYVLNSPFPVLPATWSSSQEIVKELTLGTKMPSHFGQRLVVLAISWFFSLSACTSDIEHLASPDGLSKLDGGPRLLKHSAKAFTSFVTICEGCIVNPSKSFLVQSLQVSHIGWDYFDAVLSYRKKFHKLFIVRRGWSQ